MFDSNQIYLSIGPFRRAVPRQGQALLAAKDSPGYLVVSEAEFSVIDQMVGLDLSVENYIKWHLAGEEGLTFTQAISLLLKLRWAGLLAPPTSPELIHLLDELALTVPPLIQQSTRGALRLCVALLKTPLLENESVGQRLGAIANSGLRLGRLLARRLNAESEVHWKKPRHLSYGRLFKTIEPSEITAASLREIPIFGELEDAQLQSLGHQMEKRSFAAGEEIVRQGERGDEFYVMLNGKAEIILHEANGKKTVSATLQSSDCFGEIALIENVPRTATVRTITDTETLVLGRRGFEILFPPDSKEGRYVTHLIQRIKLIEESQALSHLSGAEIRELVHFCERVDFGAGQMIMRERERPEAAFLIESGEARVTNQSTGETMGTLSRGDLVGIIGIVKGRSRTADVIAETPLTCLKIERGIFLRICMTNLLVAMFVSELTERQMNQRNAA